MKNIHILPTDKPSRLYLYKSNGVLFDQKIPMKYKGDTAPNQNIYITDNSEIKEGDWCYHPLLKGGSIIKSKFDNPNSTMEKIILTTDQDLIKDGVQAIDDDFLEWFVKNPSCEWVEVVNEQYTQNYHKDIWYNRYKIIIPKEETKQDRTCNNNCSDVCGECQILESKPLLSVEWLLRYIEDLNNKGYTFIPSSNKEIVEHIKQMEKDNMIAFLKFVFQQDGFDYEQAYNNFLKQQIL